jgi:high affinity Mn2+ porin
MKRLLLTALAIGCVFFNGQAQDSTGIWKKRFSLHFQQTVITQYKPAIHSPYEGRNSLFSSSESQTSLTSTFFLGIRLFKKIEFYFNPELAGGGGLSHTLGIAGFPNGETFRIGDPRPEAYIARCEVRRTFNLGGEIKAVDEGFNQVALTKSSRYITVVAGKYSIADYFDNNSYSHDPRTQFFNWALMSNAAWDYPANVRGYTYNVMLEYGDGPWAIRVASSVVPKYANSSIMDWNLKKAHSETVEIERKYSISGNAGRFRLLGFHTLARMGNYKEAVITGDSIVGDRRYGRTKYGWGINIEQALSEHSGAFFKASWNDGHNETWAFAEIDQSISLGYTFTPAVFHRENDILGIAGVINGISPDHRDYLAHGGYGFMIGDGKLNYANEMIFEIFYNIHIHDQHFWVTPGYQFVANPAYNMDRGPVNIFSIRVHTHF